MRPPRSPCGLNQPYHPRAGNLPFVHPGRIRNPRRDRPTAPEAKTEQTDRTILPTAPRTHTTGETIRDCLRRLMSINVIVSNP